MSPVRSNAPGCSARICFTRASRPGALRKFKWTSVAHARFTHRVYSSAAIHSRCQRIFFPVFLLTGAGRPVQRREAMPSLRAFVPSLGLLLALLGTTAPVLAQDAPPAAPVTPPEPEAQPATPPAAEEAD